MRRWLASVVDRAASRFGYRFVPVYAPQLKQTIPPGSKLHIGCGDQDIPGYIGCDLRLLPHVQLVCRAWEVSGFCQQLSEIYSRHMLEHLTLAEARLTLRDWYAALAPGGAVKIEVPNLEFAMRQWQRAHWHSAAFENRYSDECWVCGLLWLATRVRSGSGRLQPIVLGCAQERLHPRLTAVLPGRSGLWTHRHSARRLYARTDTATQAGSRCQRQVPSGRHRRTSQPAAKACSIVGKLSIHIYFFKNQSRGRTYG